jgi:RNA polymerase sigma-70 factor (ECF subfamily)
MALGSSEWNMSRIARDHYDAVYRFCARRVGIERAADVAQETFLTAQRVLHKFRGDSHITTWLFGIALNECRRTYRRVRPEVPLLEMDGYVSDAVSLQDEVVDRDSLRQALSRLSPDHREVVILHEFEGMTYEEAAEVLGVPVGTVKSRLHHAFLQLRRYLLAGEEVAR